MQLILGLVLLLVAILGYWYALPRDGKVRRFLQNDHVQAYYTVALIVGGAAGLLLAVLGAVSLLS